MTGYYVTVTVKYALVLNWSSRIVSCISKISPGAKLVRTDQFMSKETTACGQKYCHMYKKSLYNQPKPYFFKKLLWSNFWIDFNKFYTKTFRIVNILIVYIGIFFTFPNTFDRWLYTFSLSIYTFFYLYIEFYFHA